MNDELVAEFLFARFSHSDFRWNEILEYEKDGWRADAKEALRLASRQEVSVGELAGFFVTEFPHLLTMSTQIEVARALIAEYSITKRTTEG
jgi:hypothetical protein